MKKAKFAIILGTLALLLAAGPASAIPNKIAAEVLGPNNTPVAAVSVPGRVLELSPHIVPLGTAIDPQSGKVVEGYAIIHPRNNSAKPDNPGGGKGNGGKDKGGSNACFAVLSKGAEWKNTEPYTVDPTNDAGLATSVVETLVADALNEWDTEVSFDIFGSDSGAVVDGADNVSPDGKNEVLFEDVANPGAIAVTIVWGIFTGPPSGRELVEWDMSIDDTDYTWNTDGNANDMDLLNILVHEVGHATGLGHPDDSCVDESMFRFASEGETSKRDLNDGDIAGINSLY